MSVRLRIAAGLVLAGALIGFAGFKAYSEKLGPFVQAYGTTYYNGDGPISAPLACKPESEIVAAIGQVARQIRLSRRRRSRGFRAARG
jgi:hypothetical protein